MINFRAFRGKKVCTRIALGLELWVGFWWGQRQTLGQDQARVFPYSRDGGHTRVAIARCRYRVPADNKAASHFN